MAKKGTDEQKKYNQDVTPGHQHAQKDTPKATRGTADYRKRPGGTEEQREQNERTR